MSPPAPEDLARRLNSHVRRPHARVQHVAAIPFGPHLRISRWRLGNGLDVLILPDPAVPVVSYHTWFRVGSRHERPGKTGLAHLFEHLMFKETHNRGPGALDRAVEAAGGDTNAATWTDWTSYFDNLPATSLELAVSLESDRMVNLVLQEPQVASEKEVVANERRFRVEDDVEGAVSEQLYRLAFKKHPYRWPTIGSMRDIRGFTVDDCLAFYRTYYAPNNATIVVVGRVDEADLLGLLQEHYGPMRPSKLPREKRIVEPAQRSERSLRLEKPTDTEKLALGFHGPPFGSPDYFALVMVADMLTGGRSSRLYVRLVSEGEMATEVHTSITPFRDPGLCDVWVNAREGFRARDILRIVEQELARLGTEPVEETELEKVRSRLELGFLSSLETAGGKADQIGFHATVLDDPGAVFRHMEATRAVTPQRVRDVARRYFARSGRTTISVAPHGTGAKRRKR